MDKYPMFSLIFTNLEIDFSKLSVSVDRRDRMVVPFTTTVVGSTPVHGEVYSMQHYMIKFVRDL
jgi:hypothetical protein